MKRTIDPGYIFLFAFFIGGFAHQLLYILFPAVAWLYIYNNDYVIRGNRVSSLYLKFFIFIVSLTLIQTFAGMSLKGYSVKGILRYFAYFSMALFLAQLSVQKIRSVIRWIIWIFFLATPYGIFETVTKGRYEFLFHHANNLAYVIVLLIYFTCILEIRFRWLLLMGLLFNLALTKSSGGLLTTAAVLFLFFIWNNKISLGRKALISFSMLCVLGGLISLFPERILEQVHFIKQVNWNLIVDRAIKGKFGMMGSGFWRITYWIAILNEFFRNSPLVIFIGEGLDALTDGNYIYTFTTKDPHNDSVKLIVEMGIAGVLFLFYYMRSIYSISGKDFLILGLIILPMNLGNILVNFPFTTLFIALLTYKLKLREVIPTASKPVIASLPEPFMLLQH